jgi:hypothetical protein
VAEANKGPILKLMAQIVRRACGNLAGAIAHMDRVEVEAAIRIMASDPTEVIIFDWEPPTRAADAYEAGGPLDAQIAELSVLEDVGSVSVDRLIAMLNIFAAAENIRVLPGPAPWRVVLRAPGAPRLSVDLTPDPDIPEDLIVRVILGTAGRALDLLPTGFLSQKWASATDDLLRRWVARNKTRPLSDHPAYDQVVTRPIEGMPGIYLVRIPPVPFSPLLPAAMYEQRVARTIFETMEEFEEIEAYVQTPGASFFSEAPFFRMRPGCGDRPARLAGGIREGGVCTIDTPWPEARAFSVFTLSQDMLSKCSPQFRAGLHRGRYAVGSFPDRAAADAFWRNSLKTSYRPGVVVSRGSLHPRAGGGDRGTEGPGRRGGA